MRLNFRRSKVTFSGEQKLRKHYLDFWPPEKFCRHNFDLEIESLQTLFRLLISWKMGKKFDLLIIKTFNFLFRSPKIWSPDPHSIFLVKNVFLNLKCWLNRRELFYKNSLKFGSYVCLRSFQRFFYLHLDQLFDDEGMVSHGGQKNVFGLNGCLVSMFILFSVLNYFGHIS